MIDFNYTAPELLPFRIQEVLDAPNEPHRIGGVVYVPESSGECDVKYHNVEAYGNADEWTCLSCGERWLQDTDWPTACPWCGKMVKR